MNKQKLSSTTVPYSASQRIQTSGQSIESIQSVNSVPKLNHQTAAKTDKTSSEMISSKGRYKAYLADFKHKKTIKDKKEENAGSDLVKQQDS